FARHGTEWAERAELVPSDAHAWDMGGFFGGSVALSGDTALVGAPLSGGGRGAADEYRVNAASAEGPPSAGNPLAHTSTTAVIGWTWSASVVAPSDGGEFALLVLSSGASICSPVTLGGLEQFIVSPIPPFGVALTALGPASYTGVPATASFELSIPGDT